MRRLFSWLCVLAFASGCSAVQRNLPSVSEVDVTPHRANSANLYVANLTTVTVYPPGGSSPLRTISGLNPSAIATDASGNLYVANVPVGNGGNVTVYRAGTSSILRTITNGVDEPRALAFDALGNLYVANSYFRVEIYPPGGSILKRYLKVFYPSAMAFDGKQNLYVTSDPSPYGGHQSSKVLVYSPGYALLRTIVNGLNAPVALAFSNVGNLFVANYAGNTVTVYAPGKTTVYRTISAGVNGPYALLFDRNQNLYVANNGAGTVTVYSPGSSKVLRTIRNGISHPTALALDAAGNVYAANTNSVSVYAPGSNTPQETIVKGIQSPIALGFGP